MFPPTDQEQRRRVSIEQAEADYHEQVRARLAAENDQRRAETLRKPFGFGNKRWEALKAQMEPGDELWEFCDARALWDQYTGRAGYELRRDGIVIATIITVMN